MKMAYNMDNPNYLNGELRALFRYSLLDRLGVCSPCSPIAGHATSSIFHSSDEIKEKLSKIFIIKTSSAPPPHEFYINLEIEENSLDTLAQLEEYINDLTKKASNYRVALIAGEPTDKLIDKFLSRIQEFMQKKGLSEYAGEVVSAISDIVRISGLTPQEKANFYGSIANNKITKQQFYDILGNTCTEFIRQQPEIKCTEKTELSDCVEYPEYENCSPHYIRKSEAVLSAVNEAERAQEVITMKLIKCLSETRGWHYILI
jgi:hypothetical protein